MTSSPAPDAPCYDCATNQTRLDTLDSDFVVLCEAIDALRTRLNTLEAAQRCEHRTMHATFNEHQARLDALETAAAPAAEAGSVDWDHDWTAREPESRPVLGYICAVCGAPAEHPLVDIDTGTSLTCDRCAGKTVVVLQSVEDYQDISASSARPAVGPSTNGREAFFKEITRC